MRTFTQVTFNPEWVAFNDDYCTTATAPQHFVGTDIADIIAEQRPMVNFQTS